MQVIGPLASAVALVRDRGAAFVVAAALVLAACTSSDPQTFEKAASDATDRLVAQTGKLPGPLAPKIRSHAGIYSVSLPAASASVLTLAR